MNLYFVSGSEVENFDWFVVARTPEEAAKLWCEYPMGKDYFGDPKPKAVHHVPASPHHWVGVPRVLEWSGDIKDVTP